MRGSHVISSVSRAHDYVCDPMTMYAMVDADS